MNEHDIGNITSEAGVLATLVHHPEFYYHAEELQPGHFTDPQNAAMYLAISMLAKQGVKSVDPYNIIAVLESSDATRRYVDRLPVEELQEFIDASGDIARHAIEDYRMLVNSIMDAARRRDLYRSLRECERLCFQDGQPDLEQKIYGRLDEVLLPFSSVNDIPTYASVVDSCWEEIQQRQKGGFAGIPFKFPTLNEYATIERGELFLFGAGPKEGKSMMLLNCAVDLLRQGYKVLYLDSELNTRMFTARVLSYLSKIEYKRLKSGSYSDEEYQRIMTCKEWMKKKSFTHVYIPMFDLVTIYTAVKKVYHTQGIDVLIVDYFKGSGEGDAFGSYQELGRFVDTVKNKIAGDLGIAALGAAQTTSTGKLADSAKIARNASTVAIIQPKTPEEIDVDGIECGNKKLTVVFNRNGMQMAPGEYIDLNFNGNLISFEEAQQHAADLPF